MSSGPGTSRCTREGLHPGGISGPPARTYATGRQTQPSPRPLIGSWTITFGEFVAHEPDAGERTFSEHLGLEISGPSEDGAYTAELPVTRRFTQPMGIVHGGIYAAIAEEIASHTTALMVWESGRFTLGQSNLTQFLRPVREGSTINVRAVPQHRGRTSWVWSIEMRDEQNRLCAMSTVTMAVRERH